MKNIILASSSPRRIEMMKQNGYYPQIQPANIDESLPTDAISMSPEASVMFLALKKAQFVLNKLRPINSIIIAADTVVVHDGKIIGKPSNKQDALTILKELRNDCHQVITGVSLINTDDSSNSIATCFRDVTHVYFTSYSDAELDAYVNTSEPYDKAGGYAIQGTFQKYIDHIEGDFDNVVGFPWHLIESYL